MLKLTVPYVSFIVEKRTCLECLQTVLQIRNEPFSNVCFFPEINVFLHVKGCKIP